MKGSRIKCGKHLQFVILSNNYIQQNIPILFPIPGEHTHSEDKGKSALFDLFEISNNLNIELFLVSGTLLGYIREGGILSHDKDCDLGILGVDQLDILLNALNLSNKFSILPEYYKKNETVQLPIIHLPTGTWIDIFVYHKYEDKFVTGVDIQFGYRQTFKFSQFKLTKVDFFNFNVYIPDNFDLNLTENFGNWRVPDKHYISHVESDSLIEKGTLIHFISIRLWIIRAIQYKSRPKLIKLINILQSMSHLEEFSNSDLISNLSIISNTDYITS
jgi:hypothetical protein